MSTFSFNDGKPIGIIEGGPHHNKIIYVADKRSNDIPSKCCAKCTCECGISRPICCQRCLNLSGGCMSCGGDDEYANELSKIFNKEIRRIVNKEIDNISLDEKDPGTIVPIPKYEKDQVDHIFIAGPSGSGKTRWASLYIKQYKKLYPKNKFFLLSDVKEDEKLDVLKPSRIMLDDRMHTDPIPIEAFKNSVVLFDDIDTIKNKKVREAVRDLRDEILEKGRHENINVLSISHNPTNNKPTKASLLESSSVVLFPGGGDDYHMTTVLKNYCGINPKKINEIINMKSRWMQCHKKFPKYILHEKGAFFPK